MNLFGRLMLSFYAFLIALLSITALVLSFLVWAGTIPYYTAAEMAGLLVSYQWTLPTVLVTALLLFVISLRFMLMGAGNRQERSPVTRDAAGGEIAISLETFESIALSALRKIPEAKDYSAKVRRTNDGVIVSISLSVIQDVNIPELAEDIQVKTIEATEKMTGVKVLNVRVKIDNIAAGFKNKLE